MNLSSRIGLSRFEIQRVHRVQLHLASANMPAFKDDQLLVSRQAGLILSSAKPILTCIDHFPRIANDPCSARTARIFDSSAISSAIMHVSSRESG